MIGAVVSYCTNDYRFFERLIQELRECVDTIVVPVCDHFFDGASEDRRLLHWTYALHPDVSFIEVPYNPHHCLGFTSRDSDWARAWHSTLRAIGFLYLQTPRVLFMDADEIPEAACFAPRLRTSLAARRFRGHLYDLQPHRRAETTQTISLLVDREAVLPAALFSLQERAGLYNAVLGPKEIDDTIAIHHYSWCRTEAEARRKMGSWGHRSDLDWEQIIPPAYRAGSLTATLGRELAYQTVVPYFNPLAVSLPVEEPPQGPYRNVIRYGQDWHHPLVLLS